MMPAYLDGHVEPNPSVSRTLGQGDGEHHDVAASNASSTATLWQPRHTGCQPETTARRIATYSASSDV